MHTIFFIEIYRTFILASRYHRDKSYSQQILSRHAEMYKIAF